MVDIITLGEALIDFVPSESGLPLSEVPEFYRRFGGAPANVAVGLGKLDEDVGFIGKVGEDSFGDYLKREFKDNGVDVRGLYRTPETNTTLAFVSLTEAGERDFAFYRNPGADELLTASEIDEDYVASSKFLHFGSLSLTRKKSREATVKAVNYAVQNGVTVTMDPNLRTDLWDDERKLKKTVKNLLPEVEVVKLSEEEAFFLTDTDELETATNALLNEGPKLVAVTQGEKGCLLNFRGSVHRIDGHRVDVKDTTGAGDGFMAGALHRLIQLGGDLNEVNEDEVMEAVRFGNAVAAITTTDYGATSSLPNQEEVNRFIS
jgi:fructokinase